MADSLIPDAGTASTETAETTTDTSTQTETTTTTEDTGELKSFMYADGVAGEGDKPEWFKSDKYKTVSEQAKGYTELESKFGSFTGAPKDGKYEIEGVNFEDNPLMGIVAEWGAEQQLSTEGMAGLFKKVDELATQQMEEDAAATKEGLGKDSEARIGKIVQWGQNNLSADEYTALQGVATSAKNVEIIEKLIGMSKNSKLVDADAVVKDMGSLESEYKVALLAEDKNGRRLMENPDYRAKVNKMAKQLEEARQR